MRDDKSMVSFRFSSSTLVRLRLLASEHFRSQTAELEFLIMAQPPPVGGWPVEVDEVADEADSVR